MQHAHQKGIIHRDLKPSNVLVAEYDGKPTTKIIDFGIARAVDRRATLRTEAGMLVGTPEYMSPEQADPQVQDIDTRSDVYSLGVILFELLVGETPFARRPADVQIYELLRIIREVDPTPPSQHLTSPPREQGITCKDVRGDLDWITLKCLEKDRARRYQTADALAKDVRCYLDDQPVLAGPPSRTYRLRKFVRRNRGVVVAAMIIVLALSAGIVGTTIGLIRAEGESTLAKKESDEKEKALGQATQAFQRTRSALRALTDDFVEQQMARQVKLNQKDRAFLRKIIEEYESLAILRDETEEGRAIRAVGLFNVGRLQSRLGETKEAMASYESAQAAFAQLADECPGSTEHPKFLAKTLVNRGRLFRDTGNRTQATKHLREALAVLDRLVREHPDSFIFRSDMAIAHTHLGSVLHDTGGLDEAESECRRALAIRFQLVSEQPRGAEIRYQLAQSRHNLGAILRSRQMRDKAETEFREASAIREKLVGDFPDEPEYRSDLAKGHQELANLFAEVNDDSSVESELRRALAIQKGLTNEFPTISSYRRDLARTHSLLGGVLDRRQRFPEAEAEHILALAVYKPLVVDAPDVPEYLLGMGSACCNLGTSLRLCGKSAESLPHYQQGIDILSKLVQQDPRMLSARRNLRIAHTARAQAFGNMGRFVDAIEDWNQSLLLDDGPLQVTLRLQRALCYARVEPAKAVTEADALANEPNASGERIYQCASIYALASAHTSESDLNERYSTGALTLLHKCREHGHFKERKHIDDLKTTSAFAGLRERDDFRNFVADLEGGD